MMTKMMRATRVRIMVTALEVLLKMESSCCDCSLEVVKVVVVVVVVVNDVSLLESLVSEAAVKVVVDAVVTGITEIILIRNQ